MTGEEFTEFINQFEQDDFIVSKFTQIIRIQIVWLFLIIVISGLIILLGEADDESPKPEYLSPVFDFLPDVLPSNFYFGIQGDVWILIGFFLLSGVGMIRLMRIRFNQDLSSEDILFHYLAKAVKAYSESDENIDDSFQYLLKARRTLYMPLYYVNMYDKRRSQLSNYVQTLEAAKSAGELDEHEETFEKVMVPICSEIYKIYSEDEIDNVIDEIEIADADERRANIEIIIEFFKPLSALEWGRLLILGVLIIGALAIGFTVGQSWAVLLLTALAVYLGFISNR